MAEGRSTEEAAFHDEVRAARVHRGKGCEGTPERPFGGDDLHDWSVCSSDIDCKNCRHFNDMSIIATF